MNEDLKQLYHHDIFYRSFWSMLRGNSTVYDTKYRFLREIEFMSIDKKLSKVTWDSAKGIKVLTIPRSTNKDTDSIRNFVQTHCTAEDKVTPNQCLLIPINDFCDQPHLSFAQTKSKIQQELLKHKNPEDYRLAAPMDFLFPKVDLLKFVLMRALCIPRKPLNAFLVKPQKLEKVLDQNAKYPEIQFVEEDLVYNLEEPSSLKSSPIEK